MRCTRSIFFAAVLTALCFTVVSLPGTSVVCADEMGKLIKIIDKNNVDEIKDALPVSHYVRISEWGQKVRITEPKPNKYKPSDTYIAATEQNKKVRVIMDPKLGLLNYNDHGGSPFSDPKTGIEVQWNCEKSYKGDDFFYPYIGHFMGPRGDERSIGGVWAVMKWVGRSDLDPIGSFEPNPKGIEHKDQVYQTYPFELKGTAVLTVRYLDPDKADDMWIYVASLRRIRRMSTAQRCDTYIGSDFIYDDFRGTAWKVETADYKFLGKKDMWVAMNQSEDLKYNKGTKYPQRTNEILEKRPVYINEVKHHNPSYIYGKRIVYYDAQTYMPVITDVYDIKGEFWKCIHYPQNLKDNYVDTIAFDVYDMQARCSTLLNFKDPVTGGGGLIINKSQNPEVYTTAYLKKLGR